ncbi:DMT family transporter [Rugosimonospora acidiphila]|uniref:DMT family transporter n=1 Tax=Rugosimonospora acidiphila TaxID=556531 RepID=A0ABP9S946_9ACTN
MAVLAISSSAPLIAYAAAPALAIAFWRNAFAATVLAPAVGATRRPELTKLGWRGVLACALAGAALAGHFGTWVPSAKYTSIAAATALVATQPVWQGLIALAQGRRLPGVVWTGIAVAIAGAVVATGSDFATSGRAFTGDLLALAGGLMGAVYTAFGERVRATTSTLTYTSICYGACAVLLLIVCVAGGVRLHSYPATTWLAILAMTAGPQLLGHSMFNYALQRVAATTVSVLFLLEVPGAALLGWLWLGQTPRGGQLPGLGLLVVGVAIVVLGARRLMRLSPTPPEGA